MVFHHINMGNKLMAGVIEIRTFLDEMQCLSPSTTSTRTLNG